MCYYWLSESYLHKIDSLVGVAHEKCVLAGLPLEPSKTQGPACRITFLSIELDSIAMEICLPEDKLINALETLAQWRK